MTPVEFALSSRDRLERRIADLRRRKSMLDEAFIYQKAIDGEARGATDTFLHADHVPGQHALPVGTVVTFTRFDRGRGWRAAEVEVEDGAEI